MPRNRRLLSLVLVVLALAALAVGLVAGGGSGAQEPPAGGAMKLVPARALVALHLSTDGDRDAVGRAQRLVARFPSWTRLRDSVLKRLDAPGCGLDLRRKPGREAVLALLPGRGRTATSLLVTDAPAVGVSAVPKPCGSLVIRKLGKFVVIGEPEGVLAAAALSQGRGVGLAQDPVYRRAAAGLPDGRVLDAWVSPAGARDLLVPLGGLLGSVGSLLNTADLQGVVAALVPGKDHARITVRRVAGKRSSSPQFIPTLQRRAPAGTLAYVASGDLAGALQRLLVLAGPTAGAALPRILKEGGNPLIELGNLGRESAIVIAPGAEGPVLTLMSRVRDPAKARAAMLALEAPLTRLAGAPEGTAFSDISPAGAPARTLSGAASTGLTWALDGSTLIFSTAPSGVTDARARGGRLSGTAAYRSVQANTSNRITSLVFLDPNQLLRLGADTGIGPGSALQGIRDDLVRVRAIGATAAGTGTVSTVDLSLFIP